MISMDKKYQTRDGRTVRVLCVDRAYHHPVVTLITAEDGTTIVSSSSAHGCYYDYDSENDLIEVVPSVVFWVNVYDGDDSSPGNVIWFLDEDTAMHQAVDDMAEPIIIARRVELPISEDEE